jgi:outer membrane lipoprotein-sorting protein
MPPSMMNQSWMGTDFTNDDLVKEASILEDYDHSLLGDVVIEGRDCYKIQLIPKPKSAVIWGKIIMAIDKKDFMMLHVEYFDEDKVLINTMYCTDIKMLGGRLLPRKMEMVPASKKGNKTVLIYNSIVFDAQLEDSFFSTQNITKVK